MFDAGFPSACRESGVRGAGEASVASPFRPRPRHCTCSDSGEGLGVFVIDYKNAFMTLPLAKSEMPFNTTATPHQVRRSRPPLLPDEPVSGGFLVWRVLGFGGHSNPLTYSRAACFAARSGQALLCSPPSQGGVAEARLQLYVDDPAVALRGTAAQQRLAVDVLIL